MAKNRLEDKYFHDTLTPEELRELRERTSATTTDELMQMMGKEWERICETDDSGTDAKRLAQMKLHIDTAINDAEHHLKARRKSRMQRWIGTAAAVMLPVLAITTVWLFVAGSPLKQSAGYASYTEITTGKGERTTVTLPDGTRVTLNAESALRYGPEFANERQRSVTLEGEGYFKVTKDAEHPFTVSAEGMDVRVLGTQFNINAYDTEANVCLTLDEGKVKVTSTKIDKSVEMTAGDMVTMSRISGELTVSRAKRNEASSAWRQHQIMFVNAEPDQVIETIEHHYGVIFLPAVKECINGTFTGSVPDDDLGEVIKILSRVYEFDEFAIIKH